MKKLVLISLLSIPALCVANQLGDQITRATANALAKSTVKVEVKLAKPVRMSDVMFRRPRCEDRVIRVDYKNKSCTGFLSAQKTHVSVPAECVAAENNYTVAQLRLTFADGSTVKKHGKALEPQGKIVRIRL